MVVAPNDMIKTCMANKRNLFTCNHDDQSANGTNERLTQNQFNIRKDATAEQKQRFLLPANHR